MAPVPSRPGLKMLVALPAPHTCNPSAIGAGGRGDSTGACRLSNVQTEPHGRSVSCARIIRTRCASVLVSASHPRLSSGAVYQAHGTGPVSRSSPTSLPSSTVSHSTPDGHRRSQFLGAGRYLREGGLELLAENAPAAETRTKASQGVRAQFTRPVLLVGPTVDVGRRRFQGWPAVRRCSSSHPPHQGQQSQQNFLDPATDSRQMARLWLQSIVPKAPLWAKILAN
ncbi:hypothetical protein BS50DRAFT_240610 [Corynespora cassiicola Philippines]|uniref:Uncharacterized protein n=1 Tax=Corynespora cassiicola Philippines TaxID=1448308 RepID=A0A2T2P2S9_CORCC|nr:hypothetical protein BS50DRAFT_240610 [Corynespora cassiicola Philippines]